jgi:hypothetical protein
MHEGIVNMEVEQWTKNARTIPKCAGSLYATGAANNMCCCDATHIQTLDADAWMQMMVGIYSSIGRQSESLRKSA